jgi:hypothetical protein
MNHPTYETLISHIENQLPDSDRAKVEEHLSHPCQKCNDKITHLRLVLDAVAADITIAPPVSVLQRAISAYPERQVAAQRPFLSVLAELLFDSRLQLSPMASRGAARTRQMLFATQQVDIDLNITPEHSDYSVVGQILEREQTDAYPEAFVSLQNETGSVQRSIEADSLGQFTFRQIPSGVYDLMIDLGNQEVAITGLNLDND